MLAELWKNIWPWDDLNAKGPPERWLKLGLEILPALAVLVAQNPARPKLLTADLAGQLLTSSNITPSVQAVVASPAGQAVVALPDTSIYHPNDIVNVTSGFITGPVSTSTVGFVKTVQPGSITLDRNLAAICNVGDVVMRVSPSFAYGQPILQAMAASSVPGVLVLMHKPVGVSTALASGASATLVAGVAGQTIYVHGVLLVTDAASVVGLLLTDVGVTYFNSSAAAVPNPLDLKGAPLTAGQGIVLVNPASNAANNCRGSVGYGQG